MIAHPGSKDSSASWPAERRRLPAPDCIQRRCHILCGREESVITLACLAGIGGCTRYSMTCAPGRSVKELPEVDQRLKSPVSLEDEEQQRSICCNVGKDLNVTHSHGRHC